MLMFGIHDVCHLNFIFLKTELSWGWWQRCQKTKNLIVLGLKGGSRKGIRGSPKSLGHIIWETRMCLQNSAMIHSRDISLDKWKRDLLVTQGVKSFVSICVKTWSYVNDGSFVTLLLVPVVFCILAVVTMDSGFPPFSIRSYCHCQVL